MVVSRHIRNVTLSENIERQLDFMQTELMRLVRHPFFHNIGRFHGFTQDSLVMKRCKGYRTIYQKWIELYPDSAVDENKV